MDSYDELHQDYIGKNLIRSNKLSQWGHKDVNNYPKILVTARSEVLNKSEYHEWFLSEGDDDINKYRELSLVRFDKVQRDMYIDSYLKLSVKNVLHESYALMATQQNEAELFQNFSKLWSTIKLNLNNNSTDEQLLSEDQATELVQQMLKDKHITNNTSQIIVQNEELKRSLKVQLKELKSGYFYKNTIEVISIENILETPFMMEIVVQVLPTLIKQKSQPVFIKPHFIRAYQETEKNTNPDKLVTNSKEAQNAWLQLAKDQTFFEDFSITMAPAKLQMKVDNLITQPSGGVDLKQLRENYVNALLSQNLTQYDFYLSFFEMYFEKQINKHKVTGKALNQKSLSEELWRFAKNLAMQLCRQSKTQVEYKAQGLLYKKEIRSWEDEFFDDDCKEGAYKRMFRSCIPMKQATNIFSFNHKSLQEFLVAKDFIDRTEQITIKDKNQQQLREEQQCEYEINQLNVLFEDHLINQMSWSVDFMKGACNFVTQRVRNNSLIKNLMHKTIDLTKQVDSNFILFGSNSLFLLQRMGENFMDRDIQGINVKQIDLSGANFAHCNLDNSTMNFVNISGVNVHCASLRNVEWSNIYVTQLLPMEQKTAINKIFYQQDGNLVLISDNQISKDNGDPIESFQDKIQESIYWQQKEMEILYLIFEQHILPFDLIKSKKLEEQIFNHKITKVKQSAQHIIILLDNSKIILLRLGKTNTIQQNLDMRSTIQDIEQESIKGNITNFWPSSDSTEMAVQFKDLYHITITQIGKSQTMKCRKILIVAGGQSIEYHMDMKLAQIGQFNFVISDKEQNYPFDLNFEQDIQSVYLYDNIEEFIVFTARMMYLMQLKELKVKNKLEHTLGKLLFKQLSSNNQMLITLHKNKVAIWNVKSFEQIQELAHTATCCGINRNMKFMALGNGKQLKYQDISSLTHQKQLNFKDIIFASKSSNFIGMTTYNEIYYFNVQDEVKQKLLLKVKGSVFITLTPDGGNALIATKVDKKFTLIGCVKQDKTDHYGFCKDKIIMSENKQILFIKGHQFFRCSKDNIATIKSPYKTTKTALSTSYFKVRKNLLSITVDGRFQEQELEKYTQYKTQYKIFGNVNQIISYEAEYFYIIDNRKIINKSSMIIYNSYEDIIDCCAMEGGLVILHSNKIRLIKLLKDEKDELQLKYTLRPSQFNVVGIQQVLSIKDNIYGASNETIIVWSTQALKELKTILLNDKVNKMIIFNESLIAIATQNSGVQVLENNKFTICKRLIEASTDEVVDLAFHDQHLVSRWRSNLIVCWKVNDDFKVEYRHQLEKDSQKYNQSQIFIGKNKSYIYWISECEVFRQQLNLTSDNKYIENQQMVVNLKYDYHAVSLFAATKKYVVVSDLNGGLHLSKDLSCEKYEEFKQEGQSHEYTSLSISNDNKYVLTIQDGKCCIWSITTKCILKKLDYPQVQSAYFLESGEVLILSNNILTEIIVYYIETKKDDLVAVLKMKVSAAGPNPNGFYIALLDSTIYVYAQRKYPVQELNLNMSINPVKGLITYSKRYVRVNVLNKSPQQSIQSNDTDCQGASIQSESKLCLIQLFNQPQKK